MPVSLHLDMPRWQSVCCCYSYPRPSCSRLLALHRLEQQGWITAEWRPSDAGRPAKFYSLTRDGQEQLELELEQWRRLSSAVGLLLRRA